jgi:GDPmannose 4,6-dehydratase
MKKKIALIFGITGQDGSYLAEFLLNKNYFVYGVKRRTSLIHTTRIDHIYEDRHLKPNLILRYGDVTDFSNVFNIIRDTMPDEIYNLAAQSNVGVSFELPEYTAQTDSLGTLRILEAIRMIDKKKKMKFYQASTSEIFGNSPDKPYSEKSRFAPVSPYGTAKLYSYWITKNYREAYSMFTANGILFNHESPRRGENFISRKAIIGLIKILKGKQKTLFLGNLYSKRDWGHAKEFVQAQWKILQQKKPDDFVIATGKNYTVKDLVNLVLKKLNIKYSWKKDKKGYEYALALNNIGQIKKLQVIVKQEKSYFRPNEVHDLIGDYTKAKKILKWKPMIDFEQLISEMIDSDLKNMM